MIDVGVVKTPEFRFLLTIVAVTMVVSANVAGYRHQKYLNSIPFYSEAQLRAELERFVHAAVGSDVAIGRVRHAQKYRSYAYLYAEIELAHPIVIKEDDLVAISWKRASPPTEGMKEVYCNAPLVAEIALEPSRRRADVSLRWGDADSARC